jgi:hypothetical protein
MGNADAAAVVERNFRREMGSVGMGYPFGFFSQWIARGNVLHGSYYSS